MMDRPIGKASLFVGLVVWLFLYVPLVIVVVDSFAGSKSIHGGTGFTLTAYDNLVQNDTIITATVHSLVIALCVSTIATILGTLAALAAHRNESRWLSSMIVASVALPQIVIAAALFLFFVTLNLAMGMVSVVLAHSVICLAVVAIVVRSRLMGIDASLIEAARDLGATPFQAFWHVLFPLIAPRIAAGALLAFIVSSNDFVLTFFTAGANTATLSLQMYSMLKTGLTSELSAVSTMLMLFTFLLFLVATKIAAGLMRTNPRDVRGG